MLCSLRGIAVLSRLVSKYNCLSRTFQFLMIGIFDEVCIYWQIVSYVHKNYFLGRLYAPYLILMLINATVVGKFLRN
jgi:ABC-type uncharacterized transport system permease subunit